MRHRATAGSEAPLPAQLRLWDTWHERRAATGDEPVRVELRNLFLRRLPERACRVLDLGCGQGHDLDAMARAGHVVAGLDFSSAAISAARDLLSVPGRLPPDLRVHDLSEPLPFRDRLFDGAYSHFALHYFRSEQTRRIFAEIRRVLEPGGLLVFSVKSTSDRLYGEGEPLGEHIYSRHGHVRHFFDEPSLRALLQGWVIEGMQSRTGIYTGTEPSAFIRVVARRNTN
jgi:SAM-dependent methyltransferase